MRCIYRGEPRTVDDALLARMVGARPPEDFPTNGMGPERLGGGWWGELLGRLACWLIPRTFSGLVVAPLGHDYSYYVGGDEADRSRADLALGRDVVTEIAETGEHSGWRMLGGGFLVWLAVSTAGKGAFTYGGRQRALLELEPAPATPRALRVARALVTAPVTRVRLTMAQITAKLQALAKQQASVAAKYEALAKQAAAEAAKPTMILLDTPVAVPAAPVPLWPKKTTANVVRSPEVTAVLGGRNRFGPGGTPSESDLGGCLGDLEDMLLEVRACRIAERLFRDGQLTRAATMAELGRIYDRAQNGDEALLGFFSHGTNIAYPRDPLGQTNAVVMDIYDRPGDAGFASGLLTAWDVADWAASLPSEFRLWLFGDCCHLLPQARSLQAMVRPRALLDLAPTWTPRWLEPPPGLAPPASRALVGEATTIALPQLHVVGVATCQTVQTAADARMGGRQRGPGTYFFTETLRKSRRASVAQLVRVTGEKLAAAGFPQDPGVFGSPEHLAEPWILSRVA